MRFCTDHWDRLREEIDKRGLTPMISGNGEEAARRQESEIKEGATLANFDPLLGAHWLIVQHALEFLGPRLLVPNEDGEHRCPLCFMRDEHDEHCANPTCDRPKGDDFQDWIEGAVDAAKAQADRLTAQSNGGR
jgi:hypothetical protein